MTGPKSPSSREWETSDEFRTVSEELVMAETDVTFVPTLVAFGSLA